MKRWIPKTRSNPGLGDERRSRLRLADLDRENRQSPLGVQHPLTPSLSPVKTRGRGREQNAHGDLSELLAPSQGRERANAHGDYSRLLALSHWHCRTITRKFFGRIRVNCSQGFGTRFDLVSEDRIRFLHRRCCDLIAQGWARLCEPYPGYMAAIVRRRPRRRLGRRKRGVVPLSQGRLAKPRQPWAMRGNAFGVSKNARRHANRNMRNLLTPSPRLCLTTAHKLDLSWRFDVAAKRRRNVATGEGFAEPVGFDRGSLVSMSPRSGAGM
jgi:hypothetical protein